MEFDAIGSWRWSTIDRSTESETTPWPPAGSCGQWRPTWGADDEEMAHLYQVGLLTQRAHGLIPSESNLRCSPKLCFGTEMTPPPIPDFYDATDYQKFINQYGRHDRRLPSSGHFIKSDGRSENPVQLGTKYARIEFTEFFARY